LWSINSVRNNWKPHILLPRREKKKSVKLHLPSPINFSHPKQKHLDVDTQQWKYYRTKEIKEHVWKIVQK
jgi:hypothetical protein